LFLKKLKGRKMRGAAMHGTHAEQGFDEKSKEAVKKKI
jgi:hypothetical protein